MEVLRGGPLGRPLGRPSGRPLGDIPFFSFIVDFFQIAPDLARKLHCAGLSGNTNIRGFFLILVACVVTPIREVMPVIFFLANQRTTNILNLHYCTVKSRFSDTFGQKTVTKSGGG